MRDWQKGGDRYREMREIKREGWRGIERGKGRDCVRERVSTSKFPPKHKNL